MTYLDYAVYLAEIGWAAVITDRILRAHFLPRIFGFYWMIFMSLIYGVFALTHPWGLFVALCGWPLYWLFGPRAAA
jgi:hypothetical protein